MRIRQALPIACCFFFLANMGFGQSLADLARKEKERREQIRRVRESLQQQGGPAAPRSAPFFSTGSGPGQPCGADQQALFNSKSPSYAVIDAPCNNAYRYGVLVKVPRGGVKGGPPITQTSSTPARRRPAAARATGGSYRGGGMGYSGGGGYSRGGGGGGRRY